MIMILRHYQEYPVLIIILVTLQPRIAGWLRVGFCQGNFNADNCLVGALAAAIAPGPSESIPGIS